MSNLCEALLLEEPLKALPDGRPAHEVWIAARCDGVLGSGTESDPWNSGTWLTPPVSASVALNRKEVIVFSPVAHGYTPGQTVVVSGVTGLGAPVFNGSFVIDQVLTATHFKITLASLPAAAPTPGDSVLCIRTPPAQNESSISVWLTWPVTKATTSVAHGWAHHDIVSISGASEPDFNGTFLLIAESATVFWYALRTLPGADTSLSGLSCAKLVLGFDEALRTLPANTTVRVGPGLFETRGSAVWAPKSGQKILGSGIAVTTLKLVHAFVPNQAYKAVSSGSFLTAFEASDFTVDCNLGGQPVPYGHQFAPVYCGAVGAEGRHIRFRRIRAINFGTQASGKECFVIVSGGGYFASEPYDCVIEDCIVEQPALNNTNYNQEVTTCILMNAGEQSNGAMVYARGCAIRRCVVDCEYRDRPVPVAQITYVGTTAEVTTRLPHGRSVNDWVRIAGAAVNGSQANPFNGSFRITTASTATFQYTMASVPGANPQGDMWVGKWPSHYARISQIDPPQQTGANEWTVTVTTQTPHFRVPGNNVSMRTASEHEGKYQGMFTVTEVPSATQFRYILSSNPGDPPSSGYIGYIGVKFQALTADGGTAAVIEGNQVRNCVEAVYHDSWSTKELIIRNNHFRAVVIGVHESGMGAAILRTLLSLTYAFENGVYVATAETAYQNHGLAVGDGVRVAEADRPEYNGYFTVTAVIPPGSGNAKFRYVLPSLNFHGRGFA
ncbi:MAG TPA: hypothetical protein VI136_04325 [Verrucomicrobiae bacterium]